MSAVHYLYPRQPDGPCPNHWQPNAGEGSTKRAFYKRRDDWFKWIETELATGLGQKLAREYEVASHAALTLAVGIGNSGPSFAREGIYAGQEKLAEGVAKRLCRSKANVRLVRRATAVLVKIGALLVEERSGRTNLLVPLMAGVRLYDDAVTGSEVRTPASTTSDANVRPTPDATVREPRTPASDESSYLNPNIQNLHNKTPPYPHVGERGGENVMASKSGESWDNTDHRQQAGRPQNAGRPTEGTPEASDQTTALEPATGSVLDGALLPAEDHPTFERFWNACEQPRGIYGFAKAEWSKLSVEEQRRACEHPAHGGTWAGTWLRSRTFDLPPSSIAEDDFGRNGFAALARGLFEEQDGDT